MAESKKKEQDPNQPPSAEDIDLSSVGNYEAASKKDKSVEEIAEKQKSKKKKRKASKFNFSEEEEVPLPSKGLLYTRVTDDEDIVKKGRIKLYPMTAREEEILSTQRFIKDGTATRRVLERCIASDIDAKDILLFDSNFLLFYLRQISYGDEYEFELTMEMLGEKIKEIRKRRNLSQEELGKLIGVQKAQVSKLENGKSSATLATINKIFRAMRAKAKLNIEFEDESGLVV